MKKILLCALTLLITISTFTNYTVIYAENTIYASSTDDSGNTTYYYSIDDAWDAATSGGKKITLETDWKLNEELYVSMDETVYVNFNGHYISRNLGSDHDSYSRSGMVFDISGGANVTLTGGTSSRTFTVNYDGSSNSVTSGGLITGGNSSTSAGGIHMRKGAKLYLDNVAVAGNRSSIPWYSVLTDNSGAGGGIYLNEDCEVHLTNNAQIAYNYAEADGGGIFVNNTDTIISLSGNSSIHHNSAEDGGGIDYRLCRYKLFSNDGTGSISFNRSRANSDFGGGGICSDGEDQNSTISGITFEGNTTYESGGALYIEQKNLTIANCKFINNEASKYGGAIYNNDDNNVISGCEITNNKASNAGGGIFAQYGHAISLKEITTVKNNTRGDGSADDVYLDWNSDTNRAYITGGPSSWSEIGIRTAKKEERLLSTTETYYFANAFFSDYDDYHIEFKDEERELWIKSRAKEVHDKIVVDPKANPVKGKTYNGKEIIEGYFSMQTMGDQYTDVDSNYYYSDGYFISSSEDANIGDPNYYDTHLATMSMSMACSTFSRIGKDGSYDSDDRSYVYKSKNIERLLTDIGVSTDDIYINDANAVRPTTSSIGVAIGQKVITDHSNNEYILVPIAIRGQGYEAEWYSNTTIGTTGEAEGFGESADVVFRELQSYISNYNLEDAVSQGKVKFWITGYSRAGSVANLTAKRIIETYCSGESTNTSNQVYAYCFEAPKAGINSAMTLDISKYYCIHNCINPVDLVPFVAPEEMGFIRYGVDHYIPGSTDTSTIKTDDNVWSYVENLSWADSYFRLKDNNYYDVGTDAYNAQRTLMKAQLEAVDPDNIYFVDQFTLYYARYLAQAAKQSMYKKLDTNGANINQRQFLSILWRSIESWGLLSTDTQGDFRNSYTSSKSSVASGVTFQTAVQSLTKIIFSKNSIVQNGIMTSISSGASEMMSDYMQLYHIWDDVIGDWATISEAKRNEYLDYFWTNLMTKKAVTTQKAAIDYLTDEEVNEMHTAWNTVLDVLLRWVAVDYETDIHDWDTPEVAGSTKNIPVTEGITFDHTIYENESQVLLGTLAQNITAITQAHYPEVNFSWVRSYDSFYDSDTQAIKIVTDKVPVITDTFNTSDETLTLKTSSNTPGAGIYYRVKSNKDSDYGAWKPYNRAISLTPLDDEVTSYTVQMTAVYCSNVSDVVTKTYSLNKAHTVTVNGTSIGTYRVGNTVTINGTSADTSKIFTSWKDNEAITFADPNSAITTFTMIDQDVAVEANYADTISNATLTVDAPVATKALPTSGTLSWGESSSLTVNVYWQCGSEQVSGTASYNTTYQVATIVAQDVETSRYFDTSIKAENITVIYNGIYEDSASTAYVNDEGSLIIIGKEITTSKPNITSVEETSITIVEDTDITTDDLPKEATVIAEDGQTYTVNVNNSTVPDIKGDEGKKYLELSLKLSDSDAVINTGNKVLKVNITTQKRPTVPTINVEDNTDGSKTISLSGDQDTTIYYTINNGAEQIYTDPFTINGDEGQKTTYAITVWAVSSDGISSSQHTESFVIDKPYTVTIHSKDTLGNISEWQPKDITYHYYQDTSVKLAPPLQNNEEFTSWETLPEGITEDSSDHSLSFPMTQNIELTAIYKPIVNNVSLTIEQPTLGKTLATKVTSASVTFVNPYDLTNYLADITWSPNSGYPVYNTTYTAKISLTQQAAQALKFVLGNNASITVNNNPDIIATYASSGNTYDIYVTFPKVDKIDLISVEQPPVSSTTRENAEQGNWNLTTSTNITLQSGISVSANINWDTLPTFDPTNLNAQEFEVTGTVELPDYVSNSKGISLAVKTKVIVPSAPQVEPVSANHESGNYIEKVLVSLSTNTEGASIYYTLDGSDPTTSSSLYSEEIEITTNTTLKIVAIKEGMISSAIKTYTYTISPAPTPTPDSSETKKDTGWDDGGPFTTDTCGNVYDRWGNKIYEAASCNVGGYNLVGTDTKE